ncbi:HK97 family phage prohead protease [Pseudochrobactrum asaccharolyticum]|uniref:Prohead serine protease domain-containing protein n=1 Tax=Pseudochrobactrum asaccharolyticum TaxID=354351 RepID=A0A366E8L8_9HYPH|nr:HK97 family phage prohead protease [Pseudochrobactrum asaccharolyticum]RBO98716.1 hypothetical protein DFR47_101316 [Pseudochrobactrum asaccharolyticum]
MTINTGQGLWFSGYASLFSLTDLSGDIIERGAFAASLKRGGTVRMLWQHQADNPIGIWTKIMEDQRGLYVEGQLAEGVARADEAWRLLSEGALDGLSIGFWAVRSKKATATGQRHILEAELWEISLVTFPMLPQARVTAVQHKQHDENSTARIIRQATFQLHSNK